METMDAEVLLSSTLQLDKVCRTCLKERGDMTPLFGACLDEMLGAIAQIEIKEDDGLPNQMCMQCMRLCNRAYTFKKQCEKSDSILRDYIARKLEKQLCEAQEMMSADTALQPFSNAMTNVVMLDKLPYQVYPTVRISLEPYNTTTDDVNLDLYMQSIKDAQQKETLSPTCPICNEKFKLKVDLEVHMMSHSMHPTYDRNAILKTERLQDPAKSHLPKKAHQCDMCEMSFDKSWNLTRHMNKHSQVRPYSCPVCKRAFKCAAYVRKHMKQNKECKRSMAIEQRSMRKTPKVVNFHQCDQCDMAFAKIWNLNRHKMLHMQDKTRPYMCTVCERTFESSAALSGHMRCHPDRKLHACDFCNKQYVQRRSLKIHIRSHTGEGPPIFSGEKNHVCETCGKAFAGSNSLALHKRIHAKGKILYECEMCRKKFNHRENLENHMRLHAEGKGYACKVCGKAFSNSNQLVGHMRTHEVRVECDICGKKFRTARSLSIHKRIHSIPIEQQETIVETTKCVPCQACDAQFLSEEEMHAHMLNIHQLRVETVETVETLGISGLL